MTIRPIVLNGTIQRTDDVGAMKKTEDQKPLVDQQNIQHTVDQRPDALRHVVLETQEAARFEKDKDSKEGRDREQSSKEKKKKKEEGKVTKKYSTSTFDVKI